MKIKLLQYSVDINPKYQELSNAAEEVNRAYCLAHGYEYQFLHIPQETIIEKFGKCTKDQIVSYKDYLIHDQLEKQEVDALVFIDADAAVSKPTIKIEDLMDDQHDFFCSRGNEKLLQLILFQGLINRINDMAQNHKQDLFDLYIEDLVKKYGLYRECEYFSLCHILWNGGFFIVKNTPLMREFWSDVLVAMDLLYDTIYTSRAAEERPVNLCLLKKKYNDHYTFMYQKVQGGTANTLGTEYVEDETFILHNYGDAYTFEEKVRGILNLRYNKWWKQVYDFDKKAIIK